ncbi:uncharacterized protein OCT59_005048 [Rhizophagus irregularis]|uniref:uncharacterized protein n=1 Tax=Rhizophagus irregularis TaxID=588596 RepID=UPI00332C8EEE|nr:hypothetical protein OCT59_005048 [Rhizophagus irregularis]
MHATLRVISKITGRINYMDLNYTLPAEAGKHGLIINYSSEIMSEVYLGNANGYVECSILSNKGLIKIEKLDEKRIALYWYSSPNITTGEVVEHT